MQVETFRPKSAKCAADITYSLQCYIVSENSIERVSYWTLRRKAIATVKSWSQTVYVQDGVHDVNVDSSSSRQLLLSHSEALLPHCSTFGGASSAQATALHVTDDHLSMDNECHTLTRPVKFQAIETPTIPFIFDTDSEIHEYSDSCP